MSCTDCIICGGPRRLNEHGVPSCGACEPLLAVHLVSMRTDGGDATAVCKCGWSTRHPWTKDGRWAREGDVIAHYRAMREAGGGI